MEDLNSTKQENAASSDCDQFSSFLFWREPLPCIDDDLLEMLVSVEHVRSQGTRGHMTPDRTDSGVPACWNLILRLAPGNLSSV